MSCDTVISQVGPINKPNMGDSWVEFHEWGDTIRVDASGMISLEVGREHRLGVPYYFIRFEDFPGTHPKFDYLLEMTKVEDEWYGGTIETTISCDMFTVKGPACVNLPYLNSGEFECMIADIDISIPVCKATEL